MHEKLKDRQINNIQPWPGEVPKIQLTKVPDN